MTFKHMGKGTIFVFGSNLAGRHGKGAALYARQHHGAIYGQGVGLQGSSYAIPAKDEHLRSLPLEAIRRHVDDFKRFCRRPPRDDLPGLRRILTAIALTGLLRNF
jgi:hypothetical protein